MNRSCLPSEVLGVVCAEVEAPGVLLWIGTDGDIMGVLTEVEAPGLLFLIGTDGDIIGVLTQSSKILLLLFEHGVSEILHTDRLTRH
jgi:hypothetical protein